MAEADNTITIIGAGVVGLSTALYLRRSGRDVAVIVPDTEFLRAFAAENGRDGAELAQLASDPELIKAIGAAVTRVNRHLGPLERVRRFVLATDAFTVNNGQMTPTLKIKRHAIRAAYGNALLALYESKAAAS